MAYVKPNFPSKRSFIVAVQDGMVVELQSQSSDMIPENGKIKVRGPKNNVTWEADVTLKNGQIVRIE